MQRGFLIQVFLTVVLFVVSHQKGIQNLQHVDGRPLQEPVPGRGSQRDPAREPSGGGDTLGEDPTPGAVCAAGMRLMSHSH